MARVPADVSDGTASWTPAADTLDLIELVHRDLAPPEEVALHLPSEVSARAHQGVTVFDAEGVPFARYRADQVRDRQLAGRPEWVGGSTSRAFDALYAVQRTRGDATLAVVVDQHPDAGLAGRLQELAGGRHVALLVLAGPTRAPHGGGVDLVRAALRVAGEVRDAEVVALPLSAAQVDARPHLLESATRAHGATEVVRLSGSSPSGRRSGGGVVLFFTGLSGSGKSTVAQAVAAALRETSDRRVSLLDGDEVRRHLSSNLGFSREDRALHVQRLGWVAAEVAYHGGWAICSPIGPEDSVREAVRLMVTERGGTFVLVHVSTALEECERRDRKGLYARARRGEIPDFTGISAPYEVPPSPDVRIDTTDLTVAEARDTVLGLLGERGLLGTAHSA